MRRTHVLRWAFGLAALALLVLPALLWAEEMVGTVKSVDVAKGRFVLTPSGEHAADVVVRVNGATAMKGEGEAAIDLATLKPGARVHVTNAVTAATVKMEKSAESAETKTDVSLNSVLKEFWYNFRHNLFKPLLLFFYLGFLIVLLRVEFEFPYVMYQALTIYLLIAIGWKGGEELAGLDKSVLGSVFGFMLMGFCLNFVIGILAYYIIKFTTTMRRVDQATVAGYYGSDSAGTFVTCLGVLVTVHMRYDAYMPVMLAIMEVPGCLVALYLVSKLRHQGMDALGNMPDEPGYDPRAKRPVPALGDAHGHGKADAVEAEKELSLEKVEHEHAADAIGGNGNGKGGFLSPKLLHEVFLNPGLVLLFGGIIVGFLSGLQGAEVTRADDSFFVTLFQGVLCLFLLEMGMTAARKLKDLRTAGKGFILFGILAPNLFATMGILAAHLYAVLTHTQFLPGTYVLFAVLCGAASYIAVPAVQRLAIPEASPTLPLAASLGLTFSYNVTIGIPVYIELSKLVTRMWPA